MNQGLDSWSYTESFARYYYNHYRVTLIYKHHLQYVVREWKKTNILDGDTS